MQFVASITDATSRGSYLKIIKMDALSAQKLFSVKGRVALVTGGSSGIGFMIAKV